MALLAPGDHVQDSVTEAAFPIWKVTVTPRVDTPREWANVESGTFEPLVAEIDEIIRQAKGEGSRGRTRITIINTTGTSTLPPNDRWEGAEVEVGVEYGTTDDVIFTGYITEVLRDDDAYFTFDATEGKSWLELEALVPIEQAAAPDAPASSLEKHRPIVLGSVTNFRPPLVEDNKVTKLTSTMVTTASSCDVETTEEFAPSGTISIDGEEMTYSSKTATSFDGLVRPSPASHVPGDNVLEVGQMTYLVANHSLHASTAFSNLRLQTSSGALVPIPSDVIVTTNHIAVSRVFLSKQPEVEAPITLPPQLKFVDLDTVVFSDLTATEAQKCIGLSETFVDTDRSLLTSDGEGTGGNRTATIDTQNGELERTWAVVEHFQEDEAATTLTVTASSSATTLTVEDATDFPASGKVFLGSGSQGAELVSYAGKTATTLTGVVRGLNSDHQVAQEHQAGTRVSWSSVILHVDLGGGDATDANAVGALQTKPPQPPEVTSCLQPTPTDFASEHSHVIPIHDHGSWESAHVHKAAKGFIVYPNAVWIDPGDGDAVAPSESSGTTPALEAGADPSYSSISAGSDITGLGIGLGLINTNWYAFTFPGDELRGDTRQVVGCEAFAMVSVDGPTQVVTDGVPGGAVDPPVIPYMGFSSFPLIPPELTIPEATPFGTSITGVSGTWTTNSIWLSTPTLVPDNGDNVILERRSDTPTAAGDAWGGDQGTGANNRFYSLPGNVYKNDGDTMPPDETEVSGYIRLSEFDSGSTELVGYHGLEYSNVGPARVRLKNIVRGLGLTSSFPWDAGGDVFARFATHGCHRLATRNIGTMEEATYPADNAPTLAQLAAASPVPSIFQTNMKPIFDAVEASPIRNVGRIYDLTVEDFFLRRYSKGNGSLNPFDTDTSDRLRIHEQYNAMRPEVVALAPVVWIQACEGLRIHSVWIEVVTDGETTENSFGAPAPETQGPTDPATPTNVSSLTWFDVTDIVGSAADLEGATMKVVRNDDLGTPANDPGILRLFWTLELSGITATQKETPKTLVLDVEGAGITSPGGTATGAECLQALVETGFGETAADVLDEASFTTASSSTPNFGLAVTDQSTRDDLILEIAESLRLAVTWGGDGKLAVTYLPDRFPLPSPGQAFTADDVLAGSVELPRGRLSDIVTDVTVLGAEDLLEDGTFELAAYAQARNASGFREDLTVEAPGLLDEASTYGLAAHVVDYGSTVPVRVRFRTFVQGISVSPAQVIALTSSLFSSQSILVERVTISASSSDPGFVTIEGRDLQTYWTATGMTELCLNPTEPPFNAPWNGVDDDTVGVQAAIDAIPVNGRGKICFPPGVGVFDSGGVTITNRLVTFEGAGHDMTVILMSGSGFDFQLSGIAGTVQRGAMLKGFGAHSTESASPASPPSGVFCTYVGNVLDNGVSGHALVAKDLSIRGSDINNNSFRTIFDITDGVRCFWSEVTAHGLNGTVTTDPATDPVGVCTHFAILRDDSTSCNFHRVRTFFLDAFVEITAGPTEGLRITSCSAVKVNHGVVNVEAENLTGALYFHDNHFSVFQDAIDVGKATFNAPNLFISNNLFFVRPDSLAGHTPEIIRAYCNLSSIHDNVFLRPDGASVTSAVAIRIKTTGTGTADINQIHDNRIWNFEGSGSDGCVILEAGTKGNDIDRLYLLGTSSASGITNLGDTKTNKATNVTWQPSAAGEHKNHQVATAATLTVPLGVEQFHATGTTNVDNVTDGWDGQEITAVADDVFTWNTGGNLDLGAARTTAAGSVLRLKYDAAGNVWREIYWRA